MTTFKERYSLEQRRNEAERIRKKYPERIPVIVELAKKSDLPPLDKCKYLVPEDVTVGQFIFIIRKRMKLSPEKAIFVFVNNTLPPTSFTLSQVYAEHKDECGFLFLTYSSESTFGTN